MIRLTLLTEHRQALRCGLGLHVDYVAGELRGHDSVNGPTVHNGTPAPLADVDGELNLDVGLLDALDLVPHLFEGLVLPSLLVGFEKVEAAFDGTLLV